MTDNDRKNHVVSAAEAQRKADRYMVAAVVAAIVTVLFTGASLVVAILERHP